MTSTRTSSRWAARRRYHHVYALFSASGFTEQAQAYALAHPVFADRSSAAVRGLAVEAQREGGLRRGLGKPVLIAEAPDGGSGGEEFGSVLAPDVIVDRDVHRDDARGPRLRCLCLHPGEGELAGVVDALGEEHHFLVLACLAQ